MGARTYSTVAVIGGAAIALLMVLGSVALGTPTHGAGGAAGGSLSSVRSRDPPVIAPATYSMSLNGTPIFGSSNTIVNAHPWGVAYDSVNGCLYVTDQAAAGGMGYVIALGPSDAPLAFPIWGGDQPQGVAWAKTYDGEPSIYKTTYNQGILTVADTGSNTLSVFGIRAVTSSRCDGVQFIQTDTLPDWSTGFSPLQDPWDVVFATSPGLFYTTWTTSHVLTGTAGSDLLCESNTSMPDPTGLSYNGLGGAKSAVAVANNNTNFGEVTQVRGLSATNAGCGTTSTSAFDLDQPIWTVYAPKVDNTTPAGPVAYADVIAVSDSAQGGAGDLAGGCAPGSPGFHVMAELDPTTLGCDNSVALDAVGSPNPGAYGITYSSFSHRVYEAMYDEGTLESVTWSAVPTVVPSSGGPPVQVIWLVPLPGTFAAAPTPPPSATPYFDAPAGDGTLVLTEIGSGNLLFSNAFT